MGEEIIYSRESGWAWLRWVLAMAGALLALGPIVVFLVLNPFPDREALRNITVYTIIVSSLVFYEVHLWRLRVGAETRGALSIRGSASKGKPEEGVFDLSVQGMEFAVGDEAYPKLADGDDVTVHYFESGKVLWILSRRYSIASIIRHEP